MAIAETLGLGILLSWKDKASTQMKKAERTVNSLGDSVEDLDDKTVSLRKNFASLGKVGVGITAFGLAGAAAFYGIGRAAGTFQDTLRDTMTMTGLTGNAFEEMEKDLGDLALQMSTRFGMSAADINKSFYQVLSAGAQAGTKQFEALSESALMLGKVVGMEPAVAVESLSDALHSFEMDVKDAEKMADVFFKTSMLGATTVPQMADAMKEASKVAVEMKIPLQDVAAVLTGFAGKGIKGAEAGTAFRMIMTKLAAPSKEAGDALAKLGVQVYDATTKEMRPVIDVLDDMQRGLASVTHQEREAALKAIAGEEAFSKLGGLLASDLSILEGWSKELGKGGVIQTAFIQKSETLNFQFAAMRESIRNVAIVLGSHFLPLLTPVVKRIGVFAGKIREFLVQHPKLTKTVVIFGAIATAAALVAGPIITIVGLIGALGGVTAILGMVSAGFASLGGAAVALGGAISAAFWPLTAVVAAAALLYLVFKTNFLGIGTIIKGVGKVVWSFFKGVWQGIKAAITPLVGSLKQTWVAIKDIFKPIVQLGSYFGDLLGYAGKTTKSGSVLSKVFKVLGKVIGYSLLIPMKMVITPITWIIRGFGWLIRKSGELGSWIADKLSPRFGFLKKALLFLINPIGFVIAHFGKIKTAVGSVITWVSSNWGSIADFLLAPIDTIFQGWQGLKEGMVGMFMTAKDMISSAFTAIKDAITRVLDWIWGKIMWVLKKIPDALLPKSLEKLKRSALAAPAGRGGKIGGQMVVPAIAPAAQRATPRPTFPRETGALPAFAMAGGGMGSTDQSIHIHPGAVVIHANRIDETAAAKIDRELAKLIERRRERR